MEKDIVRYEFSTQVETEEHAKKIATSFHERLVGNQDYIDSNIVLNWEGTTVTITEFTGSKTHVKVLCAEGQIPELLFLSEEPA